MLRLVTALGALACVTSSFAQTQNRLYQHNSAYQDPNDPNLPNPYYYAVVEQYKMFTIHHAIANEPFRFEAVCCGTPMTRTRLMAVLGTST